MKIHFHKNRELEDGEIDATISANQQSTEVDKVMSYLKNYQSDLPTVVPIKSADRVLLVKPQNIILIDISGSALLIYTTERVISAKGRLHVFYEKLHNLDFIQISKHAIINLDHLVSLEDSFAGGMTAILTGEVKTNVSRRYLNDLEQRLGL